jgi:uncharacterized protein (DUF2384 family)
MKRTNSRLRQSIIKSALGTGRQVQRLQKAFMEADLDLLQLADKVFEGTDPAGSWLAHPAYGLGGKIPVLHARTRKGKAEVMTLMNRIEYGVPC